MGFLRTVLASAAIPLSAGCHREHAMPEQPPEVTATTGRLRGRIVDGLDNPQAGSRVFVESALGTAATAASDAAGWFSAELPPGCYSVTVESTGAPPWIAAETVLVKAGNALDLGNLVQRARPGLVVAVHGGGRPVAAAVIQLRPQLLPVAMPAHARAARERRCRTDDEGRAIVPAPPPGPSELEVRARSFLPHVQRLLPENVGSQLEIELEAANARLGSARTAAGAPLAGAEVTASPLEGALLERARCDDRGAFRFEALPARALRFTVACERGEWTFAPVQPGERNLELRLPPGRDLAGSVQDAAGQGLPGVSVAATVLGAADQGGSVRCERRLTVTTGADGNFVLTEMPAGSLTLVASSQERPAVRTELPALPNTPITLVLPAGCRLFGRLLAPDPMAGITVELLADRLPDALDEWTARPLAVTTAGADGSFTLTALPPGRVVLRASANGSFAVSPVLELGAGANLGHDLELKAGAAVAGRVQRRNGRAASAHLQLTGRAPGLPSLRAATAADGAFRLGPVPAGEYVLVYALPDGSVERRAISLAPGAVASLNLVAP